MHMGLIEIRKGFEKELKGWGLVVSLYHCDVVEGHITQCRF
jgi:hypothetical protein